MPDAKAMSGIPRPTGDVPAGTLSVRLIRGSLSNNIANHPVELHVGSKVTTVKTDDTGHAKFPGVEIGSTVKAIAVVDGERLESREFPLPAQTGVVLMLVATDKNAAPATTPDAPAISGQVVITDESRIVIEPEDENVRVFYLLDVENTARAPVNPTTPFVFDMPDGARGTGIMQGSSPTATAEGTRVTVAGPFAPGHTFVQVGSVFSGGSGTLDLVQRFPANVAQLAVVVKKAGDTTLKSPQITGQRELPADGEIYIAATGGAVAAGQPISLTVSGYPHASAAPRTIALLLAAVIVAIGVWAAGRPNDDEAAGAADRKRLIARREKLFAELVRLENDRRNGKIDDRRYAPRREELVAALENVYGALDSDEIVAA